MSNKTVKRSNNKASVKRTLKSQKKPKPVIASSPPRNQCCDTLPAVMVFADDGEFQYFRDQDLEYDEDGEVSVEARSANSLIRPGEPVPLLAFKRGGEGLWIGDASELLFEYQIGMRGDDGLVAYTMDGVRQLIELAGPGDMLIPLGPCVLQPKISQQPSKGKTRVLR